MNPEDHQIEHIRLHRALDQLMACFFTQNPAGSIHSQILDLIHWSYEKTMIPTPPPEECRESRAADQFGAQRQMILLALAELALSRPGFEEHIREIARHYDSEGLPLFESFKTGNADRVKSERGPLGEAAKR